MNKFLDWLVISSQDPAEFSLTLKGIMLQYVAVILLALRYFDVPLTETQVYEFIGIFTTITGTLLGLFGLIRKLYFELDKIFSRNRS